MTRSQVRVLQGLPITRFTLLSWNVLADAYVRAKYYPRTPRALLAAGARTSAIVERLVACDADVICLQEVEPSLLEAARAKLNDYAIHYARKQGGKPDGCATLVRGVALDAVREIAFADGDPPSGHVALLIEIESGGARVGIANTHLKWDPPDTSHDARFATRQIRELVSSMQKNIPWIACGDFNFTPDDAANAAFDEAGLADAYACSPNIAPTIATTGRARRIDYIRHSRTLDVEALPVAAIDDATVLPSAAEPSDHVAIGARISVP